MASRNKRGLGRGLEALLNEDVTAGEQSQIVELPLGDLTSGAHQPRQSMDDDALEALAQSIRSNGIVQPLVVRQSGQAYEIVAGERRWRAAQRADLTHVPAVVRVLAEDTAAAVALIENIQREDLDAIEESDGLARLINEYGMTHAQCAESVGRSRTSVSNLLRLAELASQVRDHLRAGRLNMGHARALLGLDAGEQPVAGAQVVAQGLNVRQTERLVRDWSAEQASATPPTEANKETSRALADQLSHDLSMPVRVTPSNRGGGRMTIQFSDDHQLSALAACLRADSGI